MVDLSPTESDKPAKRKGLHRFIHASRMDKYFCGAFAAFFLAIVTGKMLGREINWISWTDALELSLLWIIAGFVLDAYYRTYEKRYDEQ